MLGDRVAILFLEVARRSPWCRGTPAHVHWSLLRCPPDGGGGDGFSPLRFVLPKRQGERRRTPLPRPTGSPLPSLYATRLPTSSPRLPHLGEPDHLPFSTRRTLWPSPPQRNAPPHRSLPTRPLPSSSPPALYHLQRRRSHPSHRRAILSLRFTRDLSAFINYIATERCVSLLPGCLTAAIA